MTTLRSIVVAASACLSVVNCDNAPKPQADASVPIDASIDVAVAIDAPADSSGTDLPPPAVDTVEMKLNGVRATLVDKLFCRNGTTGIGFQHTAGSASPTLFLHVVDLSASGNILINLGTPWHMDIDDQVGANGITWGATAQGCMATIVESSTTTFELTAQDCAIKNQFGSETGMVSFRVRCTRDD
jgi:hypothetical protein